MPELVQTEQRGPVAWIRLTAPHGNALTPALVDALDEALTQAEAEPTVGSIALTSSSRSFCTGAELTLLQEVADDPLADEHFEGLGQIYDLFCHLQDVRVPTIAGVGGNVLGAGINLALACDVRIVSDDVTVRGFSATGVHPGGGHLRMLIKELGHQQAAALALFGGSLDHRGAVETGFAFRSVPAGDLTTTVLELAAGVGDDVALTRKVLASFRASRGDVLTPRASVLVERAPQVWSLARRRF